MLPSARKRAVILFGPSGQVHFLFPRGKMNRDRSAFLRHSHFLYSRSLRSRRYVETQSLTISPDDSVVHAPPSIFSGLCFQKLTKPFSRNPFRFTSIQNPRGCGPYTPPLPSITPHIARAVLGSSPGHIP